MIAANVMNKDIITIKAGTKVKEALKILQDEKIRQLPVCDDDGKIIGLLTPRNILKTALPGYIGKGLLADVSFAPDLPQFLKMFKESAGKDVCGVMDKEFVKVAPETTTMELAVIFVNSEKQVEGVAVVDDKGILLGIISPIDIVRHLSNYDKKS